MSAHYERLSYLDNSFLALESRTTHMHVAGIAVFEAAPLQLPDGGIDIEKIRRYVASRLHLIPRYRQRLGYVPVERHPVWVDDEHFNIDYHVRHTSLPKPGTYDQLLALAGRVTSQQLDRQKPLWETYVVEGLEGDRFALISKIHHCMIDGIASVDLLAMLLSMAPVEHVEPSVPYEPRPAPSGTELVVRETARRAGRVVSTLRSVRAMADDVQSAVFAGARRVRAVGYSLGSGWLTAATKTPLNGTITPNRRVGVLRSDLAQIKDVKNALGGTVNDVVLATVAGGVRKFLTEVRDFDVDDIDFRVMAPVSVRSESERGTMGNQVAMWLASMPVAEPDPVKRLEAVKQETLRLKETDQAYGAATLVRMSAGAPATLVSLASRLATAARPFNMTVTNVPGPQFPLYLLGSQLVEQFPLVPLWESHGVGIALFSYNGVVCWGFNADFDVMSDLPDFVRCIRDSLDELRAAAAAAGSSAPAVRSTRTPKKRPPLGTKTAAPQGGGKPEAAGRPSAAQEPVAKKAPVRKTSPEKPVAKKAVAEKPVAEKPVAEKPVARKAPAAKAGSTTGQKTRKSDPES